MSVPPTLVWFRLDLRLGDNPAVAAAVARGGPVVPVFVWAPEEEAPWEPGAASRWWLHHSLEALDAALRRRGSRLVIRRGPTEAGLGRLVEETGARAVTVAERVEPAVAARDGRVSAALRRRGVEVERTAGNLLFAPDAIRTRSGGPFRVFTPFWKACQAAPAPSEAPEAPRRLRAPESWPDSLRVRDLGLLPAADRAAGLRADWTPGEGGAAALLGRCVSEIVCAYADRRDRPDLEGTSRLSPHLHFGEVGPRQVWTAVEAHAALGGDRGARAAAAAFLRQLGWREFAHHLLAHFPHTAERPLREVYESFPWARDRGALAAWVRGRTGYPAVDAAMRELWTRGWMHNRARMIAASFLVKDLLLTWLEGARWFWDTLVDADLANNTLGWQWAAGCGADAAPYFRIFNPVLQGARFDPRAAYVHRWVPEVARVPAEWAHRPWEAPGPVLESAGVRLGKTYPRPVVDHAAARERALAALASLERGSAPRGRRAAGRPRER